MYHYRALRLRYNPNIPRKQIEIPI